MSNNDSRGGIAMREQLHGTTQPVLSISLEPGESIVAGEFSWMTDSIQMSTGAGPLTAYTAVQAGGTIAFAARQPGTIVAIEIATGRDYLIHQRGFLAATADVEVTTGCRLPFSAAPGRGEEFVLQRIGGAGRAWIQLSGDVVKRELAAGSSLRTHPGHVGMSDGSVAVQVAELVDPDLDHHAALLAVLSGPGSVWLQSMPLLTARPASTVPLTSSHAPWLSSTQIEVKK
jgi:uncharacterized protein (AIM24 family)